MAASRLNTEDLRKSLQGLSIIIVHVKTALFPSYSATDDPITPVSPHAVAATAASPSTGAENGRGKGVKGENAATTTASTATLVDEPLIDPRTMQTRILDELNEMELQENLGVHFVMAKQGMKIDC